MLAARHDDDDDDNNDDDFLLLSQGLVVWPRLGDSSVSQNLIELCASHSSGQILIHAYTIW